MSTLPQPQKLAYAARVIAEKAPKQSSVLVVEDDPELQWKLARILTVQGNRVVGTSTGEGAIALLDEWPVDLVLVDDELPGMSGIDVAHHLRKRHPSVPVVLMSNKEPHDMHIRAKIAGAVALLTKPFKTDTVIDMLRRLPKWNEVALAPVPERWSRVT